MLDVLRLRSNVLTNGIVNLLELIVQTEFVHQILAHNLIHCALSIARISGVRIVSLNERQKVDSITISNIMSSRARNSTRAISSIAVRCLANKVICTLYTDSLIEVVVADMVHHILMVIDERLSVKGRVRIVVCQSNDSVSCRHNNSIVRINSCVAGCSSQRDKWQWSNLLNVVTFAIPIVAGTISRTLRRTAPNVCYNRNFITIFINSGTCLIIDPRPTMIIIPYRLVTTTIKIPPVIAILPICKSIVVISPLSEVVPNLVIVDFERNSQNTLVKCNLVSNWSCAD